MANEYKGVVDITTGVEINDVNDTGLFDLTAWEVSQVSNLGLHSISSGSWGALELLDPIISLSSGTADNNKLVTQGYVDDSVAGGGYWQRVGTTLSPLTAGDNVNLGAGDLAATDITVSGLIKHNVDNGEFKIYGTNTLGKGPYLKFIGASAAADKGNLYLLAGDITASGAMGDVYFQRMNNGSIQDVARFSSYRTYIYTQLDIGFAAAMGDVSLTFRNNKGTKFIKYKYLDQSLEIETDIDITGHISLTSYLANATATMHGTATSTHIALGTNTVTGLSGQNYSGCLVLGGDQNEAKHNYATVVGGQNNETVADYSFIAGGLDNSISNIAGQVSSILNCYNCTISSNQAVNSILSGTSNQITESATLGNIVGGTGNLISGTSQGSAVLGASQIVIDDSDWSVAVSGISNTIEGGGDFNIILGGNINGIYSTLDGNLILNGQMNMIGYNVTPRAVQYAVVGGYGCRADSDYSFVYGKNMVVQAGSDRLFVFGYSESSGVAITETDAALFFPGGNSGSMGINGILHPEQSLHVGGEILSQCAEDTDFDSGNVLLTGISAGYGMLICGEYTAGKTAIYRVEHHTLIVMSAHADFSTVKNTAGKYNVYWETDQFRVQNNFGNDKKMRVGFTGTR